MIRVIDTAMRMQWEDKGQGSFASPNSCPLSATACVCKRLCQVTAMKKHLSYGLCVFPAYTISEELTGTELHEVSKREPTPNATLLRCKLA